MTSAAGYELIINEGFAMDYRRLTAAAGRNPRGPEDYVRRQVLREMQEFAAGSSEGRHALGYESGKGDLRDCVTAYLQSDPQAKADYRLTFREMPPAAPGGGVR
ncbi:putative alpha/beta-hydrolase family hydrolase [Kribbella aluminosa]|uniref:Alpha/beta-hydrolase family hydrolase n=1 Tax=Kribbella aluminosa TaxID=416017 RepID=A0ABS4UEK6_9ACTN|nr:hypothetical protein [Kribbella aluminosa]MBP2350076.1 putative alpha/beta-hydrolase family hydrolase [Kribbella aluminosa]